MQLPPEEEPDETLAAGVIDNQNNLVSILEGDKESATTPEAQVKVAEPTESKPEQLTIDTKIEPAKTETEDEAVSIKKDFNTALQAATDDKQTEVKTKSETTVQAQAGEVTARKPSTGISEQKIDTEKITKTTENGILSPLENENETAPVKEQPKQSYSEMTESKSRSKEDTSEPQPNVTTPLSEGIKPERFQAEQQIKQAVPDTPVKTENLFEEMISRINLMKTDSQNTMTIQLNPEYLGEVALELISDAAGMHVRISAANTDVRAMINAQITTLIESLEHKGIEVVEVEVTHTGIDIGAHNQAPNWERGQSGNSKYNKYGREVRQEKVDFYAGLKIDIAEYYLDMGVSSVEFSA
jgi:flagellar hook-length control protein FliK